MNALSEFAGDFVVATAGPDLESILAARGAGADEYSKEKHCRVLHFDIGGGTSNLALYENGDLKDTDCLNIGGRLVKLTAEGVATYVSPALPEWRSPPGVSVGERVDPAALSPLIESMVDGLERAIPGDAVSYTHLRAAASPPFSRPWTG